MNIGRLSNDDGKDNKNVPSYQNEGVVFFFLTFFELISLLKWQILVNFPTESWGPHPSSDSEKKLNLCVYVFQTTSQKEI